MRNIRKFAGVLLTVLLMMSLSVSVFAVSKKNKNNCSCRISSFSVKVNGREYTADGNQTFYIGKADEIDLQQISRAVKKDPMHTDAHPTELFYSYDDRSYQSIRTISETDASPIAIGQKLDFKGKSHIYFKLSMKERNETAKSVHLEVYPDYSITYHLDGGTMQGNPETFTEVTDTFTLKAPVKDGYKFLGWTGTGLDMLTAEVTIEKGSTGDRNYTANWEEVKNTSTEAAGTEEEQKTERKTGTLEETTTAGEKTTEEQKGSDVAKAGDFTSAELAKYISLSAAALLCIIWLIVRCLKKK